MLSLWVVSLRTSSRSGPLMSLNGASMLVSAMSMSHSAHWPWIDSTSSGSAAKNSPPMCFAFSDLAYRTARTVALCTAGQRNQDDVVLWFEGPRSVNGDAVLHLREQRDVDDHDSRLEQQRRLEPESRATAEELPEGVARERLGEDHCDELVRVSGKFPQAGADRVNRPPVPPRGSVPTCPSGPTGTATCLRSP